MHRQNLYRFLHFLFHSNNKQETNSSDWPNNVKSETWSTKYQKNVNINVNLCKDSLETDKPQTFQEE